MDIVNSSSALNISISDGEKDEYSRKAGLFIPYIVVAVLLLSIFITSFYRYHKRMMSKQDESYKIRNSHDVLKLKTRLQAVEFREVFLKCRKNGGDSEHIGVFNIENHLEISRRNHFQSISGIINEVNQHRENTEIRKKPRKQSQRQKAHSGSDMSRVHDSLEIHVIEKSKAKENDVTYADTNGDIIKHVISLPTTRHAPNLGSSPHDDTTCEIENQRQKVCKLDLFVCHNCECPLDNGKVQDLLASNGIARDHPVAQLAFHCPSNDVLQSNTKGYGKWSMSFYLF